MIEISVGMYAPGGGQELPFTGCFWNGHRNGYPNGYLYPRGKQEQEQEQEQKVNRMLGAGEKTACSGATELKEVA